MKLAINLFLFIFICGSLTGCDVSEHNTAQTNELLINEQPTPQKSSTIEQKNNVLSENFTVAEKTLNKAVLEKDKITIRLGLKSPILDIRKKTVEAITEINDETFVSSLIVAIKENQGIIGGGSETQIAQAKLNKSIIFALEHLTKLKFKTSEFPSSEDIQKILKVSQDWLKIHQPKEK